MAYSKLIDNIATAIDNQLNEISTRYNFDYGEEFEIAICELLFSVLPMKYGICRGFIVTESDDFAGDDIIIYDKDTFPTLRLLDKNKFDKKQEIPVEAVYAYLEAKHTLMLVDTESGQSLYKACEQVGRVKRLNREKRSLTSIDSHTNLDDIFSAHRPNWPPFTNPIFGAIISRFIKSKPTERQLDASEVFDVVKNINFSSTIPHPDLIVLGQKNILLPGKSVGNNHLFDSPFYIEGVSNFIHKSTKSSSLAVAIIILLYALDTIKLDKMPYPKIIQQQFK
jgi:hypothetical protein